MSNDYLPTSPDTVEKRLAIVVGINRYHADNEIPVLAGAENDAQEMYEKLTMAGNFTIQKNHLLIGRDATRGAILKAVSDIFHKPVDNCKLVIFYFSGHGIVDEDNQGYVAPYDMDPEDAFIYGINMEELRNVIYKSKNKASVIILLDCCYAGIAANDSKAMRMQLETETKNLYALQLKKFIESPTEQGNNDGPRGKIVLASSEPNEKSREKNDCIHSNMNQAHSHGAFSFHLIEGLDGKAADPETGIITIDSLRRYIEKQMNAEGKQKPIYSIAEASQIENIKIAISRIKFNNRISQLIKEAEEKINQKSESCFVDIQTLYEAVKKVREIEESLDPRNKDIPRLVKAIDDSLCTYYEPMAQWLTHNFGLVRPKTLQFSLTMYDDLFNLVEKLRYDELKKIDQVNLGYLIILSSEIVRETVYTSENDQRLKILLLKLKTNFLSSSLKGHSGI